MSKPSEVITAVEPRMWFEIAELEQGGYAVFNLDHFKDRRKPIYACSTLDELFEFIKIKMKPLTIKEYDR